jgi:3,4-dihydroxy 2-butanone 4-phosphate synthase/GTP cyclohydrolase II
VNTGSISVDTIEEVLEDFRQGRMVIMVDDQDRENEGDLLVAAACVTPDHINFMATHGKGLICLTLTEERCNQLELPLMVSRNSTRFSTNFTVSIEAAQGVTTGISASDRAATIRAAVGADSGPKDIVTPGHIFPIKAQTGGVLTRAGHTEAGVDMARLCDLEPASAICEILRDDGTMARLPDLVEFGKEHNLKIGTIADLISYRLNNDPTVELVLERPLQLEQGHFQSYVYRDVVEGGTHVALVNGDIVAGEVVPVRVHIRRGILDVILNPVSPWSWTLENALEAIAGQSCGVVVILAYNESIDELVGRVTLFSESPSSNLSTRARRQAPQGDPANLRMLGAGGQILSSLGVTRVLALGRKKKAHGLSGFGLEIVDYVENPSQLSQWKEDNE